MRSLFIAAVFFGLPILYFFESTNQLVAVCVLQVTYFLVCKYLKYEPYKIGDSSYYLGFMLTLLALFVSFTPAINNEFSFDANEILGNFGIAISSTILGIFFRIIEVQYSSVSDDDVSQANVDVTDALRNFAARIKVIEKDFDETSSTLKNTYRESLDQIRTESSDYLNGAKDRDYQLKIVLGNQQSEIRSAFSKLTDVIEKKSMSYFSGFEERIQKDMEKLYHQSNDSVDIKMKEFFEVLDFYRKNSDGLFHDFSKITDAASGIEVHISNLVDSSNEMKKSSLEARKQYEDNLVHMSEFNASIKQISKEGGSIINLFRELNRSIGELKISIEDINNSTEELDRLVKLNSNQERRLIELTKIRDDAVAINSELNSAVVDSAGKLLKALM